MVEEEVTLASLLAVLTPMREELAALAPMREKLLNSMERQTRSVLLHMERIIEESAETVLKEAKIHAVE
ncbi:hypothetical protein E2C01_036157 [Portunus trituberculatus]|uniref:Uncharacterized protein n=1 Tax=Portunus trituberculatus TaxID=210409 RepID=A0A5B7FDG0_PORTR|nr:hypothetical protein [Portunus trituberculatus]